jgi:putative membrane protein
MARLSRRTAAAGMLAALIAAPSAAPALAQGEASEITHRQSILTELSPTGDAGASRVFTQLGVTGDGDVEVVLPDQATRSLRNIGGIGRPQTDGDAVVWNVSATPEGTLERTVATNTAALPVSVDISYALDGETVEPGDVVGRSGELTVTYDVRNLTAEPTEVEISDGEGNRTTETIDVAVPMVGTLSTSLDDRFVDVEAPGAAVAGDGRGSTVVNWSLLLFAPLGDEHQTVSWTAQVSDAIVPEASASILPVDSDSFGSLDSTKEAYAGAVASTIGLTTRAGQLDSSMQRLARGAGQLLDGLVQLRDGAGELATGLNESAVPGSRELADGMGRARAGAGELADGLGTRAAPGSRALADGTGQARAGSSELASGLAQLRDGAGELSGGIGQASTGSEQLASGLGDLSDGAGQLSSGISLASDGSVQLSTGLQQLLGGSREVRDGAGALAAGARQLDTSAGELAGGAGQVSAGAGTLFAGVVELRAGLLGDEGLVPAVRDGISQIRAGVAQLAAGVGAPDTTDRQTLVGGTAALRDGLQQAAEGTGAIRQLAAGLDAEFRNAAIDLQPAIDGTTNTGRSAAECVPTETCTIADVIAIGQATPDVASAEVLPGVPYGALLAGAANGVAQVNQGLRDSQASLGTRPESCEAALAAAAGGSPSGLEAIRALDCLATQVDTGIRVGTEANPSAVAAATAIASGAVDVADGLEQLDEGLVSFDQQVAAGGAQLDSSLGDPETEGATLLYGASQIAGGTQQVADGAAQLQAEGTGPIAAGAGQLHDGTRELAAGAQTARDGSRELSGGLLLLDEGGIALRIGARQAAAGGRDLSSGLGLIDDGAGQLASGAGAAATGGRDLASGLAQIDDGANELASGLGDAATGSRELATGMGQLDDGANQLADGLGAAGDGSQQLADGLEQAADGGEQVADGTEQFREQGTKALAEGVSEATMDPSRLLEHAKAADERGKAGDGLAYGTVDGADASAVYQFEIAGVGADEGPSTPVKAAGALLGFGALGALGLGMRRRLV